MGRSNLLHGLERKIGTLMGERITKTEEIGRAEEIVESLPALRERIWELDTLIAATEALLKEIRPGWSRDTVDPIRPFVHQIPIRLGDTVRKAMDVLRTASQPLTTREIAESFFSRLRRAEIGTHHRIAGRYLASYAGENSWREDNRRLSNGDQFLTIAAAGLHHPISRQWKGYWQRSAA